MIVILSVNASCIIVIILEFVGQYYIYIYYKYLSEYLKLLNV